MRRRDDRRRPRRRRCCSPRRRPLLLAVTSTLRSLLARLWPHGFIAVFVAVQLALPLHYYLLRDDHHDERFAWRMFSSTRMLTCTVELRVDDQPVTSFKQLFITDKS